MRPVCGSSAGTSPRPTRRPQDQERAIGHQSRQRLLRLPQSQVLLHEQHELLLLLPHLAGGGGMYILLSYIG